MPDRKQPDQRLTLSSDQRAALLQKWMRERPAKTETMIPHYAKEKPLPLSFTQERIWFFHQLLPDSPGYNLPIALRLTGVLRVALLEKCFNEIVRRHAILRTIFTEQNGVPVQIVKPAASCMLSIVDLRSCPVNEREMQLKHLVMSAYQQPFDLINGPLLRVHIFQLADRESCLLLTIQHIVSDGWSNSILVRELGQLYTAFSEGRDSPLPPLSVQYADVVCWQREKLQGEKLEKEIAYWKQQLAGSPEILQLPVDRQRPAMQTFAGAVHQVIVPQHTLNTLHLVCRQESATNVMAYLALLKAFLFRYTAQEDLLIGLPIFNRHHKATEALIGPFMNIVVIRTSLSGNPSFREILQRVRASALSAYEYQECPFEKVVDALHLKRDTSHSPLFQVMLGAGIAREEQIQWADLIVQSYPVERPSANFDLTVEMTEQADGLHVNFIFRTDLFEDATIRRMATHFCVLCEECAAAPEQPVAQLPLLTASERDLMLIQWNATRTPVPSPHCLHLLVEEQAARDPAAIAVVYANSSLTYSELNQRANQLAHYLRERGVGPEVLVGVCLERSLDMIVALLGVLKAGGAYLPLDSALPEERLLFMFTDAGARVLITEHQLQFAIPEHDASMIYLDTDWEYIARQPTTNLPAHSQPDYAAYALYTSGSTGVPKCVVVEHSNVINLLHAMREKLKITAQDVFLAVTTLSFDIAALELFLPLIVGARVEIVSREIATDGVRLRKALETSQATFMQGTPASWRLLLAAGWQGLPELNILCGGEALSGGLAKQLMQKGKNCWNLYGPTETTIWSTIEHVTSADGPPSIGRPIANTQIYLLDSFLQPVPIGVAGELYIGGDGVVRGYLNRPDLTAERFIPHPFSSDSSMRLYKTGDLARYLANGTIEYLGRRDYQVKVRGYRIELGEIETVCAEHPALDEVVVIAREMTAGDIRLVAYFTSSLNAPPDIDELRSFLSKKLPEYMVPGLFVLLENLPLTPNGKIDRKALPNPDHLFLRTRGKFVAPKTDTERVIVEIWREILHVTEIGVQDNFFDLGGHSLLVTQVRGKLREKLGIELPLLDLFRFTTVRTLAQHITNGKSEISPERQSILKRVELQRRVLKHKRMTRR